QALMRLPQVEVRTRVTWILDAILVEQDQIALPALTPLGVRAAAAIAHDCHARDLGAHARTHRAFMRPPLVPPAAAGTHHERVVVVPRGHAHAVRAGLIVPERLQKRPQRAAALEYVAVGHDREHGRGAVKLQRTVPARCEVDEGLLVEGTRD